MQYRLNAPYTVTIKVKYWIKFVTKGDTNKQKSYRVAVATPAVYW